MKQKLCGFHYQNVTLEESLWARQRRDTIETYLAIPDDGLLHGFRLRAGRPAPGETLTGWYKDGGSNFGQILGSLAKLWRQTGDERLRAKLTALVDGWGECLAPDGFGLFPDGHNDTYLFEKLVSGLMDAYEFAGLGHALEYACRYADYTIRRMPRDFQRDGLHHPDMLARSIIEWYTLPEGMHRLYRATGQERYLAFAKEMEHWEFWNHLLSPQAHPFGPRHAYSHVNCLSCAAQGYLTTGEERYLAILKAGYDLITGGHLYATGGYGPAEVLFGPEGYLGDAVKELYDPTRQGLCDRFSFTARNTPHDNFEVSCCTWAVFKLCGYLTCFTGNASYGQWAERLLCNAMGAQLPVTPNGQVMYYANYPVNGGLKTTVDNRLRDDFCNFRWQCCTGTYPQNAAEYANLIFYRDSQENLYISQYIPATVHWKKEGAELSAAIQTRYPYSGDICISIRAGRPTEFTLRIRVPAWCAGAPSASVNGEPVPSAGAGEWLTIRRVWREGDTVDLRFPMALSFSSVDVQNPDIRALCYGPLVLAGEEMCCLDGDCENPEEWVDCVDRQALLFETRPGHDKGYAQLRRRFKPYLSFGEMEWYYVYNRVFHRPK